MDDDLRGHRSDKDARETWQRRGEESPLFNGVAYPVYILKKANVLPGGVDEAKQLAAMYKPKAIEDQRG